MKKWAMPLIKALISGLILYLLLNKIDTATFLKILSTISPFHILASVLIYVSVQCLSACRWAIILKKDVNVPFCNLLSIYLIGAFFNNFLPTLVGGDVVKGYYLYKKTEKGDMAFASVLMDRFSGYTALMAITLVSLVAGYTRIVAAGGARLAAIFIILIIGFFFLSVFLWIKKLNLWLIRLLDGIHLFGLNAKIKAFYLAFLSYREHKALLVKAVFISIMVHIGIITGYFIIAIGMHLNIPILYFFLFIPLTIVAAMLPVTFSGLGVREGAFILLFTKVGAAAEEAIGLSLVWFFIVVAVSAAGAVEYVRTGKKGLGNG